MNLDFNMIKTVFIPSLKKGKKVYGEPEKNEEKRKFSSREKKKGRRFNGTNYI